VATVARRWWSGTGRGGAGDQASGDGVGKRQGGDNGGVC
jgi:hypothetical protein